jgi:hypothetical protein
MGRQSEIVGEGAVETTVRGKRGKPLHAADGRGVPLEAPAVAGTPGESRATRGAPAVLEQDDRTRQPRYRREERVQRPGRRQPFLPWFATACCAAAIAVGSPR